jgi:hypothetical protein
LRFRRVGDLLSRVAGSLCGSGFWRWIQTARGDGGGVHRDRACSCPGSRSYPRLTRLTQSRFCSFSCVLRPVAIRPLRPSAPRTGSPDHRRSDSYSVLCCCWGLFRYRLSFCQHLNSVPPNLWLTTYMWRSSYLYHDPLRNFCPCRRSRALRHRLRTFRQFARESPRARPILYMPMRLAGKGRGR